MKSKQQKKIRSLGLFARVFTKAKIEHQFKVPNNKVMDKDNVMCIMEYFFSHVKKKKT